MKIPLSWVKDFVDLTIPLDKLAHELTMAGLEVEEIRFVGMPFTASAREGRSEFKVSGLEWAPEKFVVAEVREVMPHPNADRLILCRLYDGEQEHTVLTGAPNLFPYLNQGELDPPLKVAYAREGAVLYDGHQPGSVLTTLKPMKIRGVESSSMICSEKELGISEEHEGVIILDEDAPTGVALADYMGDAVLDVAITPNIARNANILGVARELAAITKQPLREPDLSLPMEGEPIEGQVKLEIRDPERNPRFVLGLVKDVQVGPSPYWAQRRLRLAGMRPINNIVDSTNYAMLEIGEPLHAFDYDVLVERADGEAPTIITRTAEPGETLVTLDDVERKLDDFTVLVTDTAGPLSIAGVMGGEESEVDAETTNVLLEGAAWNFINIRRTLQSQRMNSEAAYRFSRGVHPALAEKGVLRCLALMREWAGGVVAQGLVDEYPLPPGDPIVTVTTADVHRWLGIELSAGQIAEILKRLEFEVEVDGEQVRAKTPPHRLDIGVGIVGVADLMEEVARIYGYERIPETRLADELPPQIGNPYLEKEEHLRDLLVSLGLQEIISYRMTSPPAEARRFPDGDAAEEGRYVRLANPSSPDRNVLRQSLLSSVIETAESNARLRPRLALFEIGPQFFADPQGELPEEEQRLAIVLTGPRNPPAWQDADTEPMDFYDLKGILEAVFQAMDISVRYEPAEPPMFHPGKSARLSLDGRELGVMGELNPLIVDRYELPGSPLLAADIALEPLLDAIPERFPVVPVPAFPPVLEDLAVTVPEGVPAGDVEQVIREAGGHLLASVHLFDVYRGKQVEAGKKSLAYSLTYQAPDRTLTDAEVERLRQRIVRELESQLGGALRA